MDANYYCNACNIVFKGEKAVVGIKDISYDYLSNQLCSLISVYCPECNQIIYTQLDSIAASLLT